MSKPSFKGGKRYYFLCKVDYPDYSSVQVSTENGYARESPRGSLTWYLLKDTAGVLAAGAMTVATRLGWSTKSVG